MEPDRWQRLWSLYHAAAERPPEERAAFLAGAAGGDVELEREVRELLEADRAGGPLESPAVTMPGLAGSLELAPGERVGPYRIVRLLGEGGMGMVYEAQQEEPLRRRVALKLVKPGHDSRALLSRFASERRALALMAHSNIARVLDAASTPEGRPYFVMELVDGEPITDYCDRRRLTARERVALFIPACQAVQHAHQKGILHRDLKPSNLLVAEEDGRPVPKVIDFGIAKALERGQQATATQLGATPGTPEYMSPEQAMASPDVDTRSDIYSLGVILYELLTGSLPHDFTGKSQLEILRALTEGAAPRPSSRLAGLGEAAREAAGRRRSETEALRRELRRELDWVVMKALAPERARRYASAAELAADLERYLRHEPLIAGPPRASYRIGKFARRHRVGVAVAVAALLLLAGTAVVTAIQSARTQRALVQAERERRKAEEVAGFLVDLFRVSDPERARGESIPARAILDRGAAAIAAGLEEQPEVRAALQATMAEVYRNLGIYERAAALAKEALAAREQALGPSHPDVARSLHLKATILHARGELARADATHRQALEMRRELLGERHLDTAASLQSVGQVTQARGRLPEAEGFVAEALAIHRDLLPADDPAVVRNVAALAAIRRDRGDLAGARQLLEEAVALSRQRGESLDTATMLSNLGAVLHRQGDYPAAERAKREALDLQRKLLGSEHPAVSNSLADLGALLYDAGAREQAEPLYREALAIQRRTLGDTHPMLGRTLNNLALLLHERGDYEAAEPVYREALAINRGLYGERHALIASNLFNLGLLYHDQGRLEEGEKLLRDAAAMHRQVLGEEHPAYAHNLHNLAQLVHERGDLDGAEALYRQSLDIRRRKLPERSPDTAASLTWLGKLHTDRGDPQTAEPMLREALAIRREKLKPGDWRRAETESILGACLSALGRTAEAEPLLVQGYADIRDRRGPRDRRTRAALERLVGFYDSRGDRATAARYRGLIAEPPAGGSSRGRARPAPPTTGG